MPETNTHRPTDDDLQWLKGTQAEANAGDAQAIAALEQFLDNNPQIWHEIGNLAKTAKQSWLTVVSKGDRLIADAVRREYNDLESSLLNGSDNPVIRMLVDSVMSTWLELNYLRSTNADTTERSSGIASSMIKRLESAQRRHHSAIRDLKTMQELVAAESGTAKLKLSYQQPASA